MIRRVWAGQMTFAAEARRVHGARRGTALGDPRSTSKPLTILGCTGEANRPRNGRTQVYAPDSRLPQQG
jgi:hypothetical protein